MSKQIFEGVKVADFTWVGVGPITTKNLADHGATVVHIESHTRPDLLRQAPPFKDGVPGVDRSAFMADFNSSKYGVSLDLNTPKGIEIARRFVLWADVVAESFSPKAMKKWGLDYESVRRLKPDIIYFSASQQGHGGPHSGFIGFGQMMASLGGYADLTGWPDRFPAIPYGAYTDFISPFYGAIALVAALDYRRKTGIGQHLDLSQLECGIQFIAPVLMDYLVNGREWRRAGNRDSAAAPHGVYPCKGEGRPSTGSGEAWCAIAVFTDEEWRAFCRVIGEPPWARGERFATLMKRKRNEEELDRRVGEWTQGHTPEQVMEMMQTAGVAAGVVQKAEDQFADPQVRYRDFFQYLEHSVIGRHAYDGFSFRLSKTPGKLRMAAPALGQHNEYVYKKILGMTDDEIGDLIAEGVITTEAPE
ncbi:MAG: CoA transferase [Dehalococcoidia bacterium]